MEIYKNMPPECKVDGSPKLKGVIIMITHINVLLLFGQIMNLTTYVNKWVEKSFINYQSIFVRILCIEIIY